MGASRAQRVEIAIDEEVYVYCYDCDSIDLMREMHPGHQTLLIGIKVPAEKRLERARQLGREYFIRRLRRNGVTVVGSDGGS